MKRDPVKITSDDRPERVDTAEESAEENGAWDVELGDGAVESPYEAVHAWVCVVIFSCDDPGWGDAAGPCTVDGAWTSKVVMVPSGARKKPWPMKFVSK